MILTWSSMVAMRTQPCGHRLRYTCWWH
ncbi:hypothetical protein M3J09_002402 [Ascochyta lentis]